MPTACHGWSCTTWSGSGRRAWPGRAPGLRSPAGAASRSAASSRPARAGRAPCRRPPTSLVERRVLGFVEHRRELVDDLVAGTFELRHRRLLAAGGTAHPEGPGALRRIIDTRGEFHATWRNLLYAGKGRGDRLGDGGGGRAIRQGSETSPVAGTGAGPRPTRRQVRDGAGRSASPPVAARRRPSPSDELYEAPVNSFVAKFLGKSVCLPARQVAGRRAHDRGGHGHGRARPRRPGQRLRGGRRRRVHDPAGAAPDHRGAAGRGRAQRRAVAADGVALGRVRPRR